MRSVRRYRYVGPAELSDLPAPVDAVSVSSPAVLAEWLAGRVDGEPCTFVVALDGCLRLASRYSEHVALAGHQDVLAAGELTFGRDGPGWQVDAVTNQSTGYCPDPDSWTAVAAPLDRLRVRHPGDFTDRVIFRRCPACGERNIVRDDDFTCALCAGVLPARWNFASA